MAKLGYKLQEFVAHSTNVNCLNIGKKACRLFITGGDDHKVNLWAIGKPTSLMSLCGHTSPVESVTFDGAEVLVLGGASAGAIKLWDLEEAKIVRTLTGHRANCTAVEFHPFGEFFASGSSDTNLKIWDIRKKGCIHTYKGHTRGINTIKFTPDGRWVVSGGSDNVVKVWDLTAGKLLHDFKSLEGHIRSLDFHPLEFLLATGSADGTVKFWDLETFELIGSARPEATGVRAITFHPDGRTLFCGLDDCLKVYSWEPVICYDAVDMGWSTLGDFCINKGKLLGCSFYQNSVGVWVADTKLIEPYGSGFITEESDHTERKFNIPRSQSLHETGTRVRLASTYHSASPDYETKEIKNIYVDSAGGKPLSSERSLNSPKVGIPSDSKEMSDPLTEKLSPVLATNVKASAQALNKSYSVPTMVPQNSPVEKEKPKSGTETITFSKTKPGMLLRPSHVQRHSCSKSDVDKLSMSLESGIFSIMSEKESTVDLKLQNPIVPEYGLQNPFEEKSSNIKSAAEKFEKILLPETPSNQENCDKSVNESKGITSVKIVNGVAVVTGRTRTLVERFERREKVSNEDQAVNMTPPAVIEANRTQAMANNVSSHIADRISISSHTTPCLIPQKDRTHTMAAPPTTPVMDRTPSIVSDTTLCAIPQMNKTSTEAAPCVLPVTDTTPSIKSDTNPCGIPEKDRTSTMAASRILPVTDTTPSIKSDTNHHGILEKDRTSTMATPRTMLVMDGTPSIVSDTTPAILQEDRKATMANSRTKLVTKRTPIIVSNMTQMDGTPSIVSDTTPVILQEDRTATMATSCTKLVTERTPIIVSNMTPHIITETNGASARGSSNVVSEMLERMATKGTNSSMTLHTTHEMARSPPGLMEDPQISGRELTSATCRDVTEELMQTHDVFSSTLKSRLTKLQVIWHFWERNDIKGAISAMRKLPDHSVQADVIGVLMEKMEILTLDLFSCLLPVLLGLLDSKTERHAQVSLEMLLKLVAAFGPVVRSTISAPRAVGVDLHAEQRLECCNQCFMQLQKIQQILPALTRRGGVLARCAQELNLVLQES